VFKDKLYLSSVPAFRETTKFSDELPVFGALFFNTMFTIPVIPSASYFAEGLLMISIDLIIFEGMRSRDDAGSVLKIPDGFPLTRNTMLLFPRMLTLPSLSTVTDGMFFSISLTVPLSDIMFF